MGDVVPQLKGPWLTTSHQKPKVLIVLHRSLHPILLDILAPSFPDKKPVGRTVVGCSARCPGVWKGLLGSMVRISPSYRWGMPPIYPTDPNHLQTSWDIQVEEIPEKYTKQISPETWWFYTTGSCPLYSDHETTNPNNVQTFISNPSILPHHVHWLISPN